MVNKLSTSTLLLAALIVGVFMTGCKSVPVEISALSAPDTLKTGTAGTFSVTTNEDAKQPVTVSWAFGDNATAAGASTQHAFNAAGTYNVSATATNRKGKSSDVATARVVVKDMNPAAITGMRASNMSPDTETSVTFSATTTGDAPVSYSWSMGDGTTSTAMSPSHTFRSPGSYTVSLEVSNAYGTDSRTMSVSVSMFEAAICREVTELSPALFASNSSDLSDDARSALSDNLEILNECPNMNVRLEGVAAPGERRAQELSEDRARAVEQFYANNGVAASRMVTIGKGRAEGITSKKDGLAQYRRVDTIIVR